MPELPEMEHYRKQLSSSILDLPITDVVVNREKSVNYDVDIFKQELVGRQVIFVERRAKYLLFHLDNGRRLVLHLMLGGILYLGSNEDRPDRTVQIELQFAGDKILFFMGLRLGHLHLHSAKEIDEILSHLGPDPLDRRMNSTRFVEILSKRKGSLKTALINQDIISGIGNCYSDEIAFAAGIRPSTKLQDLSEDDLLNLYQATREVLMEAINAGGYMEMPFTNNDTLTGGSNDTCRVYDREGEKCPRCGDEIVKTEISSRKVFYSPGCQR